jgi:hypothetical protein
MPVDKNEAPEGYEARPHEIGACKNCSFRDRCNDATPRCVPLRRNDKSSVYFIKKERLEKAMEEYEHMTANTREAWRTIVDAIFRGDCEIKRSVVKPEGIRGIAVSVVWDRATHIENGREYRWKKPAPPKVKKLVDRTPEEFWPLIGRYWAKDSAGRRYLILNDTWHSCAIQEGWQIAPIGTEDWEPMMIERLVDSE